MYVCMCIYTCIIHIYIYTLLYTFGGFLKWGYPQIIIRATRKWPLDPAVTKAAPEKRAAPAAPGGPQSHSPNLQPQ